MASPDIYSRTKGRDFTDTKNPLDKAIGDFEPDEPSRSTQKPWGWYPFLYESQDSFTIGDAGFFWSGGGDYPVPSVDLWQFPNAEQFAGLDLSKQETAPATDLMDTLCTAANITNNPEIGKLCMNLAVVDGCRSLQDIFPKVGQSVINVSGTLFPNGCKMNEKNSMGFGPNIGQVIIDITCPTNQFQGGLANFLVCSAYYFEPPGLADTTIPATGQFVRKDFATARDSVIACLKAAAGNCFEKLGCHC